MEKVCLSKVRTERTITWDEESTMSVVNIEDYIALMKIYGRNKAKSVRSARRYLRSLGLILNRAGEIIGKE